MVMMKPVVDKILSIFETGKLPGPQAYSSVTILNDGAGVSYGKHQATDAGGNLDEIVQRYCDRNGKFATQLDDYLDELAINATARFDSKNAPEWVHELIDILRTAGADPMMQAIQDQVFDERYWEPMVVQAAGAGLKLPLSYLALYDTAIQSGPGAIARMRRLFPNLPPSRGGNETVWVSAYIRARHTYLMSFVSSKTDPSAKALHEQSVRKSSYRTLELIKLIDAGNWNLESPLKVRGIAVL